MRAGNPLKKARKIRTVLSIFGRGIPFTIFTSVIDAIPEKKKPGISIREMFSDESQTSVFEPETAEKSTAIQKKAAVIGAGRSFQSLGSGFSEWVRARSALYTHPAAKHRVDIIITMTPGMIPIIILIYCSVLSAVINGTV